MPRWHRSRNKEPAAPERITRMVLADLADLADLAEIADAAIACDAVNPLLQRHVLKRHIAGDELPLLQQVRMRDI